MEIFVRCTSTKTLDENHMEDLILIIFNIDSSEVCTGTRTISLDNT